MTKKLYPHFNPEVHKIKSKIATVRTSHHCKYNIHYHIVWIPKYRKPILTEKVVEVLKAIIHRQYQEMSIQELALEMMPDHLHLFVGANPTVTPFKIIHKLKGNTSIQLRRCFPELRYLGYKQILAKVLIIYGQEVTIAALLVMFHKSKSKDTSKNNRTKMFEYDIYSV
jgi:putative transposase